MMYALPLSPDCREGKHRACDETAWDDEADELCGCGCDCHARRLPRVPPKLRCTLCGWEQTVSDEDPDVAVDDAVQHAMAAHGHDPRLSYPKVITLVLGTAPDRTDGDQDACPDPARHAPQRPMRVGDLRGKRIRDERRCGWEGEDRSFFSEADTDAVEHYQSKHEEGEVDG